jgi:hypothetical protein
VASEGRGFQLATRPHPRVDPDGHGIQDHGELPFLPTSLLSSVERLLDQLQLRSEDQVVDLLDHGGSTCERPKAAFSMRSTQTAGSFSSYVFTDTSCAFALAGVATMLDLDQLDVQQDVDPVVAHRLVEHRVGDAEGRGEVDATRGDFWSMQKRRAPTYARGPLLYTHRDVSASQIRLTCVSAGGGHQPQAPDRG